MANTAIVTGASSGMGRAIAERIIKSEKFDEVWVIARREERLHELIKLSKKTKVRRYRSISIMRQLSAALTNL